MIPVETKFAVIFGRKTSKSKFFVISFSTLETNSITTCVSFLIGQCHYPIRLSLVDQSTCQITIVLFENYPFLVDFWIFFFEIPKSGFILWRRWHVDTINIHIKYGDWYEIWFLYIICNHIYIMDTIHNIYGRTCVTS